MKTRSTMTNYMLSLFLVFTCLNLKAQNNEKIMNALEQVKVGGYLNDNTWLINLQGDTVRYATFKGKWLLIDFWSTGCAPCIKEFPTVHQFYLKNNENFHVVAVSVDKTFQKFAKSSPKYKIQVPSYFGGFTYDNPFFNLNVKKQEKEDGSFYFFTSTPQYVIVNPDGMIVDKELPKPSEAGFQEKISYYLQEYAK